MRLFTNKQWNWIVKQLDLAEEIGYKIAKAEAERELVEKTSFAADQALAPPGPGMVVIDALNKSALDALNEFALSHGTPDEFALFWLGEDGG